MSERGLGNRVRRELEQRDAILSAVSEAARRLLVEPLAGCGDEVLTALARAADVTAATLYAYHDVDGRRCQTLRHSYAAEGIPAREPANWVAVPLDERIYGRFLHGFAEQRAVQAHTREMDAIELSTEGLLPKSYLAIGIYVGDELWGDVGFEEHRRERVWSAAEVDALAAFAGILGGAVARERAEQALLDSQRRLQESQRLEALGRLAGGVAHDFNNLLTVIHGHTELLLGGSAGGSLREIAAAAERGAELTRRLLAIGRRQPQQQVAVDLAQLAESTAALLAPVIGDEIELAIERPAHVPAVLGDPGQLQQVVLNLALNARDAMPRGGGLRIAVRELLVEVPLQGVEATVEPGRYVVLDVEDSGVGMDAETLSHAFEPFFTTRGEGTGLGLATAIGIVRQSGGEMLVVSEPGRGSRFSVLLPVSSVDVAPLAGGVSPAAAAAASATVLLVEDDRQVRELVERTLAGYGYDVLSADGPERALELFHARDVEIDVLLSDVRMPGMSGPELVRTIRGARPAIACVLMSGYDPSDVHGPGADDALADVPLIQKPFTGPELNDRLRDVLAVHV